jgi:4-hydroxy-tetrahydrodipicolinate synthase
VFGAILTALVTPFDANDRVDEAATASIIRHVLAHGSDGVVMSATTGEASTLTDAEKIGLFQLGKDVVGPLGTVIANTGSNDTAHSVHLTEEAAKIGVDAVLAVTPYYNRPPRAGIVGHFAAIAAVGLPVIVYNIPGRCGLNLEPSLLAELAGIPNIVGLKQANPDLDELRAVMADTPLAVYAGNDDMLLPVVEGGGAGVISVASHIVGEQMAAVVAAGAAGDLDEARRIDTTLADLEAALFVTTSPILIKAAVQMLGLIPSDRVRLPMVTATPVQRDILRSVLEQNGVLTRA